MVVRFFFSVGEIITRFLRSSSQQFIILKKLDKLKNSSFAFLPALTRHAFRDYLCILQVSGFTYLPETPHIMGIQSVKFISDWVMQGPGLLVIDIIPAIIKAKVRP